MFKKIYLTTILKKSNLLLDVNSSLRWNHTRVNLSNAVMRCISPFVVPHRGAFSVSQNNQNNYAKFTTKSRQQKTASEKAVVKMHWKYIKLIISEILEYVKRKIPILKFSENKPKTPRF